MAKNGMGKNIGARGFEPPAFRTRNGRATKLRYAPTELLILTRLAYIHSAIKLRLPPSLWACSTAARAWDMRILPSSSIWGAN